MVSISKHRVNLKQLIYHVLNISNFRYTTIPLVPLSCNYSCLNILGRQRNDIFYNQSKHLHTFNIKISTFLLYKTKLWLLFESFSEQNHICYSSSLFSNIYLQIYSLSQSLFVNLIQVFHHLFFYMYHIRMLNFHMVQKFQEISDEILHQIFFE